MTKHEHLAIFDAIHRVQVAWFGHIIDTEYLMAVWVAKYGGPRLTVNK